MSEPDRNVIALDNPKRGVARSGSKSRALVALQSEPNKWMTLQEIAEISGLSPNTLDVKCMRQLMHGQLVERKYTYDEDLEPTPTFRIKQPHRGLSIAHDASDRRRA